MVQTKPSNINNLNGLAIKRSLKTVKSELGASDRSRIELLETLIPDDGIICLADVLDTLYPEQIGQPREKALTALRQLRKRLTDAGKEANIDLALKADSKTRNEPKERWCWFEGGDDVEQAIIRYTTSETNLDGQTLIEQQGAVRQREYRDGKPVFNYFVSYAHADQKQADEFCRSLEVCLQTANHNYYFEVWQDPILLAGDDWFNEIKGGIANSDFGLMLVSKHFLASEFIAEHELPAYITPSPNVLQDRKRTVPVLLKPILFDGSMNLRGLEKKQFYQLNQQAYSEQKGIQKKDDFVLGLFQHIQHFVPGLLVSCPDNKPGAESKMATETKIEKHTHQATSELDDENTIDNQGVPTSLNKSELSEQGDGSRCTALSYLEDWLKNPKGQHYCALLAEYGMGKTTTSMMLARRLIAQRKTDPTVPLPIYLDLRHLGDTAKREDVGFEQIISKVIERSWKGGGINPDISVEEVVRHVQTLGALIIFDGLDEVLVHLTQAQGQRFTRELYRVLPPQLWIAKGSAQPGRLLVTCRSHYFRTLREQKNHLLAEDRENLSHNDYAAFMLLPFSDQQIETYLSRCLPKHEVKKLVDTIGAVHNLSELAQRPYLLKLISGHIEAIERWRMQGRLVTGVTLYREFVSSWLERDKGKHQIKPKHKQQLMQYFAAELWRSGEKSWDVEQTEEWLVDFLHDHPKVKRHYDHIPNYLELLTDDLRTATFLVREGEDHFRFAHSSLQEYFVAAYLFNALEANTLQSNELMHWALPKLSHETLVFFGQHMLEAQDAQQTKGSKSFDLVSQSLMQIRDTYRPQVSERFFDYILLALGQGYPLISLLGLQMQGAQLAGLTIAGLKVKPLRLERADFSGADLADVTFEYVTLKSAKFDQANLQCAEFLDCNASLGSFVGATLVGTKFCDSGFKQAKFEQAEFYRTQWLGCDLSQSGGLPTAPLDGTFTGCVFESIVEGTDSNNTLLAGAELQRLGGHESSVMDCAFSPNDRSFISASRDGTVRLWDVASGDCLRVFKGHGARVNGCAFLPGGDAFISASSDKTLRLWDKNSGECLRVFKGHESGVNACAVAPDGLTILSASNDNTLRLWALDSGLCLQVLDLHKARVLSCAFAPNGLTLLSASRDKDLRLWDSKIGHCLRVFSGHEERVSSCTFAPDGLTFISASYDDTLRLWDVKTGDCLRVFSGHSSFVFDCAFAPDGQTVLSVSLDDTLRLWDVFSGECLRVFTGHQDAVRVGVFSADGQMMLSAADDKTLRLWDKNNGHCLRVFAGHQASLNHSVFSPDGQHLLSADSDKTLRLWALDSGECLRVFSGHLGSINHCAFSADGLLIVSASDDRTLRLWDASNGECLRVLSGHERGVTACGFSLDSLWVFSASADGTLRLWDTNSGECLQQFKDHGDWIRDCAISADDQILLSASDDKTLRLWDINNGECLQELSGHESWVQSCAFSPDGQTLLSASNDETLRLWHRDNGQCLQVFSGHQAGVNDCAFAPDGQTIISASSDNTLRLWDITNGECLRVFSGHEKGVNSCSFSPDGQTVVSSSYDGTMRLWDIHSGLQIGLRWQVVGENSWVVWDSAFDGPVDASDADKEQKPVWADKDVWRHLGYSVNDPDSGEILRLPFVVG
ncbi:MAG: WD40 repeat protein [Phenylobacterium sp.]|jgi:WD40 repeat protein